MFTGGHPSYIWATRMRDCVDAPLPVPSHGYLYFPQEINDMHALPIDDVAGGQG